MGHHKLDYEKFVVACFSPFLFSNPLYRGAGCGANALALLTGISPLRLKQRSHWADDYMVRFLRHRRFSVAEITRFNVTDFEFAEWPISPHHVILMSNHMSKTEASWSVVHNKMIYHNFEIAPLTCYEYVNHPILTSYLVKHPSWIPRR